MRFPDFGKLASNNAANILHIALYKAQNFPSGNRLNCYFDVSGETPNKQKMLLAKCG